MSTTRLLNNSDVLDQVSLTDTAVLRFYPDTLTSSISREWIQVGTLSDNSSDYFGFAGSSSVGMAEVSPFEREIKISSLINFNFKLKEPIIVKITKVDDEFLGTIDSLELYSFGESEAEVERELNIALTDLFNELLKYENNNLGKHPRKWKKVLEKYINIVQ